MTINTLCIPLSAVQLDFVDVLTAEDTRKARSTGKLLPDFWTVEVIKANTFDEYTNHYHSVLNIAHKTTFEFGERKTVVPVYAPDALERRISRENYVLYTWMLLNLLCSLSEHPHIDFKLKFNLDDLINELAKHSPELPRWLTLRRNKQMFEVPILINDQPRVLETRCSQYSGAYGYINGEFIGEVFFNLFPTHNPNWFHLERALFTNEADSVHFVLDTGDKWNRIIGNK